MDLYFSRRRFFQTAFLEPRTTKVETETAAAHRDLKEVYKVTTTVRKHSILPDVTTIEYVGAEDEEKHYVVATIEWCWPSQKSSVIEIDGKRMSLKELMKREDGLFGNGTHIMVGDERFTWRSSVCRPAQLFDAQNRSVVRFTPRATRGFTSCIRAMSVRPSCLHLEPTVAADINTRDFAIASFFVYRACRDLQILLTPWWREKEGEFTGLSLKN